MTVNESGRSRSAAAWGGDERCSPTTAPSPDPLSRDLDLPAVPDRERIHREAGRATFRLDVHVLATVGAFRVVPLEELHQPNDGPRAPSGRRASQSEGLVRTMPYVVGRDRATLVTLTERGRDLLEARPTRGHDRPTQSCYQESPSLGNWHTTPGSASLRSRLRPRRQSRQPGSSRRPRAELKRDYQRSTPKAPEGNWPAGARRRGDCPLGTQALPMVDDHVRFPDVRLGARRRTVVRDAGRRGHDAAPWRTRQPKVHAGFTRYCHRRQVVWALQGASVWPRSQVAWPRRCCRDVRGPCCGRGGPRVYRASGRFLVRSDACQAWTWCAITAFCGIRHGQVTHDFSAAGGSRFPALPRRFIRSDLHHTKAKMKIGEPDSGFQPLRHRGSTNAQW